MDGATLLQIWWNVMLPMGRPAHGRAKVALMPRMGMVIGLRPEKVDAHKALHATPWPEMDAALKATHIGNYSIYLRQPENLLFA